MFVVVTDHAVERFRQRIGSRTGALDPRGEIATRVGAAVRADRVSANPPDGRSGKPGSTYVFDLEDRDLVFICRHDRPNEELIVISMWDRGRLDPARVPQRFTDALVRR